MKWSLSGHFEWWQVVTFCLDTKRFVCTCAMWRQRRAAGEEVVRSDKGSSNTHRAGRGKCPRRGFPSTSSPQHATHLLLSLEVCCIAVASQNSGWDQFDQFGCFITDRFYFVSFSFSPAAFVTPICIFQFQGKTNRIQFLVDLWGNPARFLLWWMAQGSCTYPVAVKCDPCPWAVHLFGLLDLVGLGKWWADRWEAVGIGKRYEKERRMQFLVGLFLLLLFPPPSTPAANAAGLQECIILPSLAGKDWF